MGIMLCMATSQKADKIFLKLNLRNYTTNGTMIAENHC